MPVSQPGDPLELHADGVAARLLAGMDPAGSGGSAGTGRGPAVDVPQNREESGQLDAAGNGDRQGANASAALRSLPQSDGTLANQLAGRYGEGQPLDETLRRAAEPLLGYDLGEVRIHPYEASEMARAVAARAFTVGRHIYFSQGEYNPGARDGMGVLLHELAHITQPGGEAIQRWPRIASWNFRTNGTKSDDNCALFLVDRDFKLGVDNQAYGPGSFTNGMELRANIAGHEAGVTYDIKRLMEWKAWERVGGKWNFLDGDPPGTADDPDNNDECLAPGPPPEHIYVADAPGLGQVVGVDPAATEVVVKHTFFEWVDMEKPLGGGVESTNTFAWHSIIWLTKNRGAWKMDKARSTIASGKIKVDPPAP